MENNALTMRAINTIRFLAVDAVQKAKSGHPGTPMGLAPLSYLLWTKYLRYNPANPDWAGTRPVRPLLRPRLHAPLLPAPPHGVRRDPRRPAEFPPMGEQDPRAPGGRAHPRRRGDHGPAGTGAGERRRHGDGLPDAGAAVQPPRARDRLPSDRGALLRRRPDGGGRLRGGVPGRIPPARESCRVLRRQPDHHRRVHGPRLPRGRGGPLPGVRVERADRRGREHGSRRVDGGDRGGLRAAGAPHPGDRADEHRVRQPQQAGHRGRARGAAGGGRGRPREGTPRVARHPGLPRARRRARPFPGGAGARGEGGEGVADEVRRVRRRVPGACPRMGAADVGRSPRGMGGGDPHVFTRGRRGRPPGARPARC